MAIDPTVHARTYLQSTRSLVLAGRRLLDALGEDRATVEFAVSGLEQVGIEHAAGGSGYRAFMFSTLDASAPTARAMRERVTEDTLITVLADVQAANVLMAAGRALGETGEQADPALLDETLLRLETTRQTLERSLDAPLEAGTRPGRFGFVGEAAGGPPAPSPDLPSAIAALQQRIDETLTTLVTEAQGVVTTVLGALDKIDRGQVLQALARLGDHVGDLPRVGRLFRRGAEVLGGALTSLIRLLGSDALAGVRGRVETLWGEVKGGRYVAGSLERVFGIRDTRARVADILGQGGLDANALDRAATALQVLSVRFKETMGVARTLTSAVTTAGTLLALTPMAGPPIVLLTASVYVLVLAAVTLIGADYVDSGGVLRRVRGVGEIVGDLRPA